MSILQYKKILSIAEALIRKTDLPQDTINKYEALKLKILTDPPQNEKNNTLYLLESEIKQELINLHTNFLETMTDLLSSLSITPTLLPKNPDNFLSKFHQIFEEKKRDVRDVVIEAKIDEFGRSQLKKYLNDFDEFGLKFDRFIDTVAQYQESQVRNFEEQKHFLKKIENLEEEKKCLDSRIENLEKLTEELKEVESENKILTENLKEKEEDYESQKEVFQYSVDNLTKRLEECLKDKDLMLSEMAKIEEKLQEFCAHFTHYTSPFEEFRDMDMLKFDNMANFLSIFVQKIFDENYNLNEKIEELSKKVEELDKELKCKLRVEKIVKKIENCVQSSKEIFGEVENITGEYQNLMKGNFSIKSLNLNSPRLTADSRSFIVSSIK